MTRNADAFSDIAIAQERTTSSLRVVEVTKYKVQSSNVDTRGEESTSPSKKREGPTMSNKDKAHNSVKQAKGKAKEVVGAVTGDEQLETEGKVDQSKANLSQAAEKVKDAFKK